MNVFAAADGEGFYLPQSRTRNSDQYICFILGINNSAFYYQKMSMSLDEITLVAPVSFKSTGTVSCGKFVHRPDDKNRGMHVWVSWGHFHKNHWPGVKHCCWKNALHIFLSEPFLSLES